MQEAGVGELRSEPPGHPEGPVELKNNPTASVRSVRFGCSEQVQVGTELRAAISTVNDHRSLAAEPRVESFLEGTVQRGVFGVKGRFSVARRMRMGLVDVVEQVRMQRFVVAAQAGGSAERSEQERCPGAENTLNDDHETRCSKGGGEARIPRDAGRVSEINKHTEVL